MESVKVEINLDNKVTQTPSSEVSCTDPTKIPTFAPRTAVFPVKRTSDPIKPILKTKTVNHGLRKYLKILFVVSQIYLIYVRQRKSSIELEMSVYRLNFCKKERYDFKPLLRMAAMPVKLAS